MDSQILVIIFLLFSAVSTLIKKLQERRNPEPDETKLRRKSQHPSRDVGPQDPFEEDVDLSEWEVLLGAPKREQKPEPEPEPQYQEFQEVRGKRTVSETNTGPEFQEIQGKRTVTESNTDPEFHSVQATRPVNESQSYNENDPTAKLARLKRRPQVKKKQKRSHNLKFSRKRIRQAIIYNEIIGKPRSEDMPF